MGSLALTCSILFTMFMLGDMLKSIVPPPRTAYDRRVWRSFRESQYTTVKACANSASIWSFMPRNLPEAEYSMVYSNSYEGKCEDQSFRMGYDTVEPPCEVAHIDGGRKQNNKHYVGVKFNGSVLKITAIRIQGYGARNTKGVNAFSLKYKGPRGKAVWYKNGEGVTRVFRIDDLKSSQWSATVFQLDPPIETKRILIYPQGYQRAPHLKFDIQECYINKVSD